MLSPKDELYATVGSHDDLESEIDANKQRLHLQTSKGEKIQDCMERKGERRQQF